MADIKTRDTVKGTTKALDKAATIGEHIKPTYTETRDKTEQGYHAEKDSPTEYASDKVFRASGHIKDEGIHQFNEQGQRSVTITKESIGRAKGKIAEFKTRHAVKVAEQKKTQAVAEQNDSLIRSKATSRSPVSDVPKQGEMPRTQTGASRLMKMKQQEKKTIKTTVKNAEKTVKTATKGTVKTTEKGVKTAKTTSKTAIKTTEQTVEAAQKTAKVSAKAAQRTAQAAKTTAEATAEATKATVRTTIAAVKAIIAGTKALISAIIAGGWIAVSIIPITILLGCAVSLFGGGNDSTFCTPVSTEAEAYTPLIRKYAKQYGIPEYVELIKVVMMQESGGKGGDPVQAAEGSFSKKYSHEPDDIRDPEYSIECGVQELKTALTSAEVESPIDMGRIKLALQGYNFSNGYISWVETNYGGYSYASTVGFSTMQAQRLGQEKYGDTQYPAHVLRYYPYGRAFTDGDNQATVEVALIQLGNEDGQPYWSWYGFDGRVEWCTCFVSWCSEQCGYLESGIIPKFSLCSDGVNWFEDRGQWQDKNYESQTDDLISLDWGDGGPIDHVGIAEKCENGTVYTVEGNSGDACKWQSYPVGNSSVYDYGLPAYWEKGKRIPEVYFSDYFVLHKELKNILTDIYVMNTITYRRPSIGGDKMSTDEKRITLISKAFCDENHVRIIKLLHSGEKCACKALEEIHVTQPTLSHHMKVLCDSGIVIGRKEGKWVYYSTSSEGTEYAINCLREVTKVNSATENKSCCDK